MIEKKKLFTISLIVGFIIFLMIDMPLMLLNFILEEPVAVSYLRLALLFIINSILAVILFTLIYSSLKKIEIVKKIYCFALFIAIVVFVIGIIILVVSLRYL